MAVHIIPTAAQYKAAFQAIELTDREKSMLVDFYNAHNRSTATAIGDGNLAYGRIGRKIGEAIEGYVFPMYTFADEQRTFYCGVLGELSHYRDPATGFNLLVMQHELAKAIEQLEKIGCFA